MKTVSAGIGSALFVRMQKNSNCYILTVCIRTIDLDPQEGFRLNGQKMKLNGVCEHHDLGALGVAFKKTAMKRRFEILIEMGVNAIRTAHNMPAPEVMDLFSQTLR